MTIGMDIGTSNIQAYVPGAGSTVSEPSVLAIDSETARVVAVGRGARDLEGRAPARLRFVHPVQHGLVGDLDNTRLLVRHVLRRALGWRWRLRPAVVLSVPVGTSSYEKRSLVESVLSAGARKAELVPHPLAAARGAGLPVSEPRGSVLIDVGSSHTEIALIAMGGVAASTIVPVGGQAMDEAIAHYLAARHHLDVSIEMAEEIKLRIGSAHESDARREVEAMGRDLETGLARRLCVTSEMAREALAHTLEEIGRGVRLTLEHTPPALADDIVEHGLVLTGGGATLPGLAEYLHELTQLPARVADAPEGCAATGALQLRKARKQ